MDIAGILLKTDLLRRLALFFSFPRLGIGLRQCLPAVALCCLMPATMAAPTPPSPAASAALTKAVKQAVQTAYDAQDAALLAQDANGAVAIYTPNAVFFSSRKGAQDVGVAGARQGWVAFLHVPNQTLTAVRHDIKAVTLNKAGTGATVLTVHYATLSARTSKGTAFTMGLATTLRCFWVKTGGGWRIKQERVLGVDGYLDGKLFEHNHKRVPS